MTGQPILPLSATPAQSAKPPTTGKIEDFRPGYPRFTALIASHSPFFIFRRFNRLRARLLLLKQDQLSILESELDQIDQQEKAPIFLGKSRIDRNAERLSVLSRIESALVDYDSFIDKTNLALTLSDAESRDVQSLRNWVDGNGCLAGNETSYLEHDRDLVSLVPTLDNAVKRFESWIEERLVQFLPKFRESNRYVSSDPNVHIYNGPFVSRVAKGLLICLVTLLLLLPIVVCNVVSTAAVRIFIVMLSTIVYLLVLSGLTRAKTTELVVAGTTYATVLIVFVSGTSDKVT
ncbi:hypothetical protein NW761_014338 [Fusarium oxysporum]|uniref:DUF6594 domain-containing protein n=2 Tax=Fusarium oxysporum f. sp. pisi HDV247 TaxID=1080344 RepID=W9P1K0_FUSOX|nr:hypothetical protein FOVG_15148 [Fusarium oxysporum f. sp. pisi HDV247]KAJ4025815.1 hypothetical protein NW758_014553 [Fusarium oxysporum]KAJ4052047.1 hypothetical protein NW763_008196 [Fusarium oxysporum]KAJ4069155.1 hypothetical protein NW753_000035 [Fusarium oxysporum]KAJ4073299.1 hypothetical protein NW761_014338 [Fusarium oxysporum]